MAASAAQTRLTPEEILPLTSIQCELPLREIYGRVTFSD